MGKTSVADPDPFYTDPDNAFHFDPDPDPAFHFDTDPEQTVLFLRILTVSNRLCT
jgi:hypothetical protein